MSKLDRREFLAGSVAFLGAGAVGVTGGALAEAATRPHVQEPNAAETDERSLASQLDARLVFDGAHQAGILNPAPAQATFVALDSIAADRSTLIAALKDLSTRSRSSPRVPPSVPRSSTTRRPTAASWVPSTLPTS